MLENPLIKSILLLFVLLNPFLLTVYLLGLIRELDARTFRWVLLRAAGISFIVFYVFAITGDMIFRDVLQVRFASFLIFGGLIFLVVGIQFVFQGANTVEMLRGSPGQLAGAIAMPFMIGPGTISASIVAGANLSPAWSAAAIAIAMAGVVVAVLGLKALHDWVHDVNTVLVDRYVEVVGRLSSLIVGTIAVEMILHGIELWLSELGVVAVGSLPSI